MFSFDRCPHLAIARYSSGILFISYCNTPHCSWVWWYMPWEAEAGGSQVLGQPGLHCETLSQKTQAENVAQC
jgi:hypothetical protein